MGLHGVVEGCHGRGEPPRIGETSGSIAFVSSSALVECGTNPGGAAADKVWSQPRSLHIFCAIWGDDLVLARIHRVDWRCGH